MNFYLSSIRRNFTNYFAIAFAFAAISILISSWSWILITFLLLVFVYQIYGKSAILFFSIFSLLTITSNTSSKFRVVVQIANFGILFFLFIKENGFEKFKIKLPKNVQIIVILILSSISISLIFSNYFNEGYPQLIRQILFFILIFMYYSLVKNEDDIKTIIYSLITVGLYYSFVIIYFFASNNFNIVIFISAESSEFLGKFINKNAIGLFLSTFIFIMLPQLFNEKSKNKKIAITLLLIYFFICIVLSNARGSLLALLITLLILFFILNKKIFWITSASIILSLSLIMIPSVYDFIQLFLRFENISTGRDTLLNSTINVIKNNFFFGSGPAAVKYEMYKYLDYMLGSFDELMVRRLYNAGEIAQAHSFYLFYFSELGILGFATSIIIPFLILKMTKNLLKFYKQNNIDMYYLIFGMLMSLVFIFILGFLEPSGVATYGMINTDLPFWLIVSIISFYYMRDIKIKSSV